MTYRYLSFSSSTRGTGMQLTHRRISTPGDTGILFPRLESWNNMTEMATVAANVNKERVLCRIPMEILKDKFGASEEDPMRSIAQHRAAIQEAARKLIENELYEEDGSILIHSRDFEAIA
jgi:hypothetical protein